jgi:twitching motility protein PilT
VAGSVALAVRARRDPADSVGMDSAHSRAQQASFAVGEALRRLVELGGSDLCLKVGNRPLIRVDGRLRWLDEDARELGPDDTIEMLHAVLPDARLKEFEDHREVDFAYSVPALARFRVNAFRQRGTVTMVFRIVPYSIRTLEQLGLPEVVRKLAEEERGVILVTGTTGSGKSTTLAAMIEHMNQTMFKHIVTIEDPIEYLYRDRQCAIDQREVGSDTDSFETALRRVMRQDPDVILIGEMRDESTVRTALAAAETGHLVLSTVHTLDAPETINRILDFFPATHHQQVRAMLAGTLKGIISQRLVARADGIGRIAIAEVLTMTGRVHDLILDATRTGELPDVIEQGAYYGMQTFDQALYRALTAGDVSLSDALRTATRPHDLQLLVDTQGHLHTTMADVLDAAPDADAADGASAGLSRSI